MLVQIHSTLLKTFSPFSRQKRLTFAFHLLLIYSQLYFPKQWPKKALFRIFFLFLFGLFKVTEYLLQLLLNFSKIIGFFLFEILSDHVPKVYLLYLKFYFYQANQQEQNLAINLIKLPFYRALHPIFFPLERIQ